MPEHENSDASVTSYRPNILGRWVLLALVRLPVPWLCRLGRGFGWLFYILDRKRKHFARVNLELCFPELGAQARKDLLREHFKALGQGLFATLGMTWVRPKERLGRWVTWEHKEILEQAIANRQNIILMAPHFVGLEVAVARLTSEFNIAGMYRPPRRNILHWAIDERRSQYGGLAIASDAHMKQVVRILKSGMPFYYLPDLDQGRHVQYEFAPFFGHEAATVSALSRLAKLTNALVIPCITKQGEPGEPYTITLHPPFENFPGPSLKDDAIRLNSFVEEQVRTAPAQYFWIHRRFKTRPEGEPSPYRRKSRSDT